jgi:phenylacetate-coenzyme A ligase PaaK-like adenylate-forming protein
MFFKKSQLLLTYIFFRVLALCLSKKQENPQKIKPKKCFLVEKCSKWWAKKLKKVKICYNIFFTAFSVEELVNQYEG